MLLTRNVARREETHYAKLIRIHPTSKRERTLVHYHADNPPPDNDDDLIPRRKGRP